MLKASSGKLTEKQAMSPTGCGGSLHIHCYALILGSEGFRCGVIADPSAALDVGYALGWQINIDTADDRPWCPLGIIGDSKIDPELVKP
jgi:hypothetical protein